MREIIVKFGRFNTVLLITFACVLLSLLINWVIGEISDHPLTQLHLLSSIISPIIIAPLVTWFAVGLIIEIHNLEREMRLLATYDALTEALTRHAFDNQCNSLFRLSQRNPASVSVLFMDIDNFKAINDNYGHLVGDRILKSLGQTLNRCKRVCDLVGRFGGDELVVMLPNTDSAGAMNFAHKIQTQIQNNKVEIANYPLEYSVSIGLSVSDLATPIDLDELFQMADRALYQAKKNGKNCIVNATSLTSVKTETPLMELDV